MIRPGIHPLALKMQPSGHIRRVPLWRSVTRFDGAKIASDVAIRNSIGIVLPLIAGAALGYPSAGAIGALGALNVSYSDSRDPYITRGRRMFVASVLVGIAVAAGALSGHANPTAVLAAALWAFAAGMMVVLGTRAADLGVTTLVTLVVFAARPLPLATALESGLVAFCGGLLQTALSIAVWPLGRYRPERRMLSSLYRALSNLAVSPAGPDSAPPGAEQIAGTREGLASLAEDHSVEAERYVFLLSQAERIRLSLLTLRRLHRRIERDPEGGPASAALERILTMSQAALELLSGRILRGEPDGATRGLTEAARQFRENYSGASIRDASLQIDALAGQLRAAGRVTASAAPRETKEPWRLRFTGWRARLHANLSFDSTAFRHAVRLAVCIGAGDALGRGISLQRTYWLPMTVAIVLRPDFTATFTRGILRLAGTMAGLLLATGLFHFFKGGAAGEIVLLAGFAFLMRWIGPANYGIFVTALSALVVLLLAIGGVDPKAAISARAVNTAIGGVLALGTYRLWPTWERAQAGPALATLLDAYRNYFTAILKAYAGEPGAGLDKTRSKARVARANAEAFVGRIAAEPGIAPERTNLLNAMLVASHSFVRAAMALESALYQTPREPFGPAAMDFARKAGETLQALADALRTGAPPGELPDLRAAHNLLENRESLAGVEMDRIVTSLNTLREQIGKLPRD